MTMRTLSWLCTLLAAGALAWSSAVDASHLAEQPKRHKVLYHLDEPGGDRAQTVLVNSENHVHGVGWKKIEALELVVHGPALRTFLAKDIDPDVRGKLETLLAGGLRFDACQITMTRQKIDVKDLIQGVTSVPSGVVRVMELQEAGYAYIRP